MTKEHCEKLELIWGLLWMVNSNERKVCEAKDLILSIVGDDKEVKDRAIQRAMKHGHTPDICTMVPRYRECRSGVCE